LASSNPILLSSAAFTCFSVWRLGLVLNFYYKTKRTHVQRPMYGTVYIADEMGVRYKGT
jgi:hypothetical protein